MFNARFLQKDNNCLLFVKCLFIREIIVRKAHLKYTCIELLDGLRIKDLLSVMNFYGLYILERIVKKSVCGILNVQHNINKYIQM